MRPRLHHLDVGPALPLVLVRLAVLLTLCASAWWAPIGPVLGWIATAAAVAGAVLPRSFGTWIALGALLAGNLLVSADPGRTALLVCIVSVVHGFGALALITPWRARITLRALVPTVRRLLLVQLVAQPVALLLGLLPVARSTGAMPLAAIAAVAGAAALAAVLYRLLRPSGSNVRGPA